MYNFARFIKEPNYFYRINKKLFKNTNIFHSKILSTCFQGVDYINIILIISIRNYCINVKPKTNYAFIFLKHIHWMHTIQPVFLTYNFICDKFIVFYLYNKTINVMLLVINITENKKLN